MIALQNHSFQVALELIQKGAKINIQNDRGANLLHYFGNLEHIDNDAANLFALLIKNKIDINKKDKNGYTPLHYAASGGVIEILSLLIQNNANINATTKDNKTPLYLACDYSGVDAVSLLLSKNADPNLGKSPLVAAALFKNKELVELLINSKIDINKRSLIETEEFLSNNHIRGIYETDALGAIFLNYSIHGNVWELPQTDCSGIEYCDYNRLQIFEQLIKAGANINSSYIKFKDTVLRERVVTPLSLGIRFDDLKWLKYLMTYNIDIKKSFNRPFDMSDIEKDYRYKSYMQLVYETSNEEIINLLESHYKFDQSDANKISQLLYCQGLTDYGRKIMNGTLIQNVIDKSLEDAGYSLGIPTKDYMNYLSQKYKTFDDLVPYFRSFSCGGYAPQKSSGTKISPSKKSKGATKE